MDPFVTGSHLTQSHVGVGKLGRDMERPSLPLHIWASVYYKTVLRPEREPGKTRPWKGSGLTQMWMESSTLSNCPASQAVTDPGSKRGPGTQVDHSLLSLVYSLPSAPRSMSPGGDQGPVQEEDVVIKNKCTRERKPRKRQCSMNLNFLTCSLKSVQISRNHRENLTNPTPSIRPRPQRAPQTSKILPLWGADKCPSPAKKYPTHSPLFSVGNKAGLGKTTQRTDKGKEVPMSFPEIWSPLYGQKYWKRILVEQSTITGKWLRNAHGTEGAVRGAAVLLGRHTVWEWGSKGKKQAGEVQDLARQNFIGGHIMLGLTTSHSKNQKGHLVKRLPLDTGEEGAPEPGFTH